MKNYFLRKTFLISLAGLILAILVSVASAQNMFRKVNDFDGDGKSDYAVTRIEGGQKVWYIYKSLDGYSRTPWGLETDVSASGDYSGDGITDIAIMRSTALQTATLYEHRYFILQSPDNTVVYRLVHHNHQGMYHNYKTMHQDYTGDGTTDAAVWYGSATFEGFVTCNCTLPVNRFLQDGHLTIRIGDMYGNGRAEGASYHPNTHAVNLRDYQTGVEQNIFFGVPGDEYVPADFDADGKGDLTIFRGSDGTWWWMRSSDNVIYAARWGQNGDTPVPGDYDNDGKTDMAIYRPGPQSYYWVNGSQNGVSVFAWGITNDQPVRY